MSKKHQYQTQLVWTGNAGKGTSGYTAYERSYTISIKNKTDIKGSSDPDFRGDATKHNPEELFVASLSACHMLWYLHLCADAGITVLNYQDQTTGIMQLAADGSGHFTEVTIYPVVTIKDATMISKANALHAVANKMCFLANSCNFPVRHQPECKAENQ